MIFTRLLCKDTGTKLKMSSKICPDSALQSLPSASYLRFLHGQLSYPNSVVEKTMDLFFHRMEDKAPAHDGILNSVTKMRSYWLSSKEMWSSIKTTGLRNEGTRVPRRSKSLEKEVFLRMSSIRGHPPFWVFRQVFWLHRIWYSVLQIIFEHEAFLQIVNDFSVAIGKFHSKRYMRQTGWTRNMFQYLRKLNLGRTNPPKVPHYFQ